MTGRDEYAGDGFGDDFHDPDMGRGLDRGLPTDPVRWRVTEKREPIRQYVAHVDGPGGALVFCDSLEAALRVAPIGYGDIITTPAGHVCAIAQRIFCGPRIGGLAWICDPSGDIFVAPSTK